MNEWSLEPLGAGIRCAAAWLAYGGHKSVEIGAEFIRMGVRGYDWTSAVTLSDYHYPVSQGVYIILATCRN